MAEQTLTLRIPEHLYQRLKQRAEGTHRPIELAALDLLAANASEEESVAGDLQDLHATMDQLPDEELWAAARNTLAREAGEKLRRLRVKQRRTGLTLAEWHRRDELLRQYDRGILIRAHAAALLKARGHDVDVLLEQP